MYASEMERFEINTHYNTKLSKNWNYGLYFHANTKDTSDDRNNDGFRDSPTGNQLNIYNRFQYINPDLNLSLLTVASMSAFASCVIGGPVANMMIILEHTSDYQATLVAGVIIVFASLVSYKIIYNLYKITKLSFSFLLFF